ncbi:MAG: tetratricopeptide repeat protein [bacterium]
MILLILIYTMNLGFCAEDNRASKVDFYKGAKEFINEINSIISNKEELKKMESDEKYEGKVENIEILEQSNSELSKKSFEDYIQKYPNSSFVPDALYRLSKLYYEETAQRIIKDTENYEKEYQKFLRGETQSLPPEPSTDYSDAIRVLNMLVNNYPNYKYRDESLYLLGYTYFEQGNIEKGIAAYQALISEYPKSDKLSEVYTRLGEHYFDSDDLSKAVYYYSQVLEHPDSPYYENVIYKLAWTYYHKKRIDEASSFFVSLIDYNDKKFGSDYVSSTINEAKNYIAIGYAESPKGIKGAYDFFRKIGGRTYEYEILSKICELYASSDRLKEALTSIAFLFEHYPYNPDTPVIHEKIINSIKPEQNLKLLNTERDKMIKLLEDGSVWREKNKDNTKAIFTAEQIIKRQLIAAAFYHQERGEDKNDRKEYITAAQLYYNFLKKYPMDGLVLGARLNYAKVLFNLKDYDGAIQEFSVVEKHTEDEKIREESGFSLVTSWQNKLKKQFPRKYLTKEIIPMLDENGKLMPVGSLSYNEGVAATACKEYETDNPNGKRIPQVLYVKAELYFRNNMFDEARGVYNEIIGRFPKEKVAVDSVRNMIAMYTYENNYTKIEEWSKKLLASGGMDKNINRDEKEINSLLTGSVFKSAKAMDEEGRFDEAANEYVRLAKQYPKSEYSDAALYNAGLIYEKRGNSSGAIKSYKSMLARYPGSKNTVSALFRLAVNYEQQLDFYHAVLFYNNITKKYWKTAFASDANYNAARISRAFNQYDKAAEHYMAYGALSKNKKERASSLTLSASLYEKAGKYLKALNAYDRYIKENKADLDGVIMSHISRARIYEILRKKNYAYVEYNSVVKRFNASGSPSANAQTVNYNAEARFKMVSELSSKYHSIKVKTTSVKEMKTAYEVKQHLLQKLSDQYLKIINLGSPEWSVASLYMIGLDFQNFADFLYEIPVPKQLNTDDLINEYKSQIQTQALPYEDSAIEYYEKSIAESARLKTLNDWTRKAKSRLTKLKPEQYKESKEEIPVLYPSIDIKVYGFMGK